MTLEQAFAEVSAAGFVVNNLFQIDQATKWKCNLMSVDARHYGDYGIDEQPAVAVMAALAKMKTDPKDSLDIPPGFVRAFVVTAEDILS